MKKVLAILVMTLFIFVGAAGSMAEEDISEILCPCGCGGPAIACECGSAKQILKDRGITEEQRQKALEDLMKKLEEEKPTGLSI